MKTGKTIKGTLLAATAASALMMAAAVSAQAETIFFNPGGAGGGDANFTDGFLSDANLNAFNAVDTFNWAAYNDTLGVDGNDEAVPVIGSSAQSWAINDLSGGLASTNTLLATGNSFSESFDFHLTTVQNTTAGGDTYGISDVNNSIVGRTHVFMQATLGGTVQTGLAGGNHASNLNTLVLDYDQADFQMFFDADGDKSTLGDNELIASFGGVVVEGIGEIGLGNIFNLLWEVSFDEALAGRFAFDAAGLQDITAGGVAGVNPGLTTVGPAGEPFLFKLTQQAVVKDATQAGDNQLIILSQSDAAGTSVINSVPEPGALALFGAGLLGMGLAARRRAKAHRSVA